MVLLINMKANYLPADWANLLVTGSCEQQLRLLSMIEGYVINEAAVFQPLFALLSSMTAESADDGVFAVRLKTLIIIGRSKRADYFQPLAAMLPEIKATHWRLAILDALLQLPATDKITATASLLQDKDWVFVRGLVWFLGHQGRQSLDALNSYLFETGRYRAIHDGLLAESLWLAIGCNRQAAIELADEDTALGRFCRHLIWPTDNICRYGIYPYPDYLWQIAKTTGVSAAAFKSLYYHPRPKHSFGDKHIQKGENRDEN